MTLARRVASCLFAFNFFAIATSVPPATPHSSQPTLQSQAPKKSPPPAKSSAPPAKSPSAPAQSNSAPQHRFAVQVGAFAERPRAEALVADLTRLFQGHAWIQIEPLQQQNVTLHRVRILATTRAEAAAFAERLRRERNLPAWVIPLS